MAYGKMKRTLHGKKAACPVPRNDAGSPEPQPSHMIHGRFPHWLGGFLIDGVGTVFSFSPLVSSKEGVVPAAMHLLPLDLMV